MHIFRCFYSLYMFNVDAHSNFSSYGKMLDFLFGWRKASKCKKLMKQTECRLKLLKSKAYAVVRLLKKDIAQLLESGHEDVAMNKLDRLYIEENIVSIYEMLTTFSDFILLNLSYIRRHKDIPNDIKEAISTLMFASARIGCLPELGIIRKLFTERYGKRFVTAAIELYPGNLVNCEVKEKFSSQSAPEDVKKRMVDEIVRDFMFKHRQLLAIEYKPDVHVVQDVEELRPNSEEEGRDQRLFMFRINIDDHKKQAAVRKRMRRKESVSKENPSISSEIYCSSSPGNSGRKYQKNNNADDCCSKLQCSLDQPCYFYSNNNNNNNNNNNGNRGGYDTKVCNEIIERSLQELGGTRNNEGSPRHVHPKLPDYDKIVAVFGALKKAHQLTKSTL